MTKNKKRKINIKLIITLIFIILLVILGFCFKDIISVVKNGNTKEIKILDKIENYNYSLNEYDSEYFKQVFKQLKKELSNKDIDEKEYASLVSKLFVIDFFSLNNSLNKNDVGGKGFVYTDYQADFLKKAKDGIYKYVENNIYGKRSQKLPSVKEVTVSSIKTEKVEFQNDISDSEAYTVELKILYKENLEYPESVKLILVHNEKLLEIAKME